MLRHQPNPRFEADLLRETVKTRFRNTRTGEVVVGEYSSTLTSNLRYRNWRNVGRPSDIESLAEERLGLRVIHTHDPSEWEEESWRGRGWRKTVGSQRFYSEGPLWRAVPRYKTLVAVDDRFLERHGLGTMDAMWACDRLSFGLHQALHVIPGDVAGDLAYGLNVALGKAA